jgi:serine/threonine-protein kinase
VRFFVPYARSAKVPWFRDTYHTEIMDRSVLASRDHPPSIVAHSFGTLILGNAMLKYDWLRFDKIILCGSILPVHFPWDMLFERGQIQAVRNEYGVRDTWSGLVQWFVHGTGPSGRDGFSCTNARLQQERFDYTHSEYFNSGHMEAKWLPFLAGPPAQTRAA